MPTLKEFAAQHGQTGVIARALTYCPHIAPALWNYSVEFNSRLSRAAGYCHPARGVITLHPGLLSQAEGVVPTLLHETAHAIQYLRYGLCDHGATWWEAMHQLGQQPKRCHNMQLKAVSLATNKRPDDLDL